VLIEPGRGIGSIQEALITPTTVLTRIALLALALSLVACGPTYRDTDHTASTARVIPEDLTVHDELNVGRGDLIDWKTVTPIESGRAELVVRIGDPFKGKHGLTGQVTVYDVDAREYTRQPIEPNVVRYDLTWHAESETTYLIKLEGIGGKSKYSLEFRVDASPPDPCANVRCPTGSYCESGRCVAEIGPDSCDPPCGRGAVCRDGRCQGGCAGGCPSGQICSSRQGRCVKDPCAKKRCSSGEVCRGGVCRKRGGSGPRLPCQPECGEGTICKRGKCVVAPLGPISAKIVQAVPRGAQTTLFLNKGKRHKVKVGQTGSVKGVGSFKITEVFEYRCKAVIGKPATALGNAKTGVIYR
jgi:hypothetical protein